MNPPDPVVIIAGPTGSGKTDVATALAREMKAEVVSADSRQVYRNLSVGTAKPRGAWATVDGVSRYVSEGVVHHLVDFLAPEERFDAGRFARDAGAAIEDARARGRRVVVAGGTGLYLRALARGIAELSRGDETLRGELADLAAREGRPALHARLAAVDPEAAAAIPPNNLQRVIRALEIYRLTGRPITHWHRTAGGRSPWPFRWFGLKWPPADYDDHLKRRCAGLWPGLLDETRRLLAGNLSPAAPAFESLGYREAVRCLTGVLSPDDGSELFYLQTRQYAKRQMTWFRGEKTLEWVPVDLPLDPQKTAAEILARLKR